MLYDRRQVCGATWRVRKPTSTMSLWQELSFTGMGRLVPVADRRLVVVLLAQPERLPVVGC